MRISVLATIAAAFVTLASVAQAQFLNLPQYDNGTNLTSFVQADVNGDGKTDVLGIPVGTSGLPGNEITVLLGNGTGGFGTAITTAMSGVDSPNFSTLGDFNGDGHLDVALFGKDHVTGQNAIAVMLGNGDGTFQAGKETVVGTTVTPTGGCAVGTADFNGDGKVDLAFTSGTSVVVLPGKGDGTFSSPLITSTGSTAFFCLAAGDFNNDKKLDLAVQGPGNGGSIAMMLGNGNGTFQAPFKVGNGGGRQLIAAELNGDGDLDLVAARQNSPAGFTALLGDGTGHFPHTHTYAAGSVGGDFVPPVVVQDLNGDGRPDLALRTTFGRLSIINIFLNNGDGSFTAGKTYNSDGPGGSGLLGADLNGDQKVDLAIANAGGGISVLLGNGNGTFQGNFVIPVGPQQGIGLPVGNFTASPKPDLVLANFNNQLLLSNGDGTFTLENTSCGVTPAAIGDFNKDGKLDLAGPTQVSGVAVIGVCLGNGNGTFTVGGNFDQGITHRVAIAGDFNNDGKLDLAVSDQGGFSILLGNGDGTFQNGIPTAANATFPNLTLGDFNNDGKLDVAMPTSSGITVFLGKGDGTFESPIISPGPTGFISVTDLNKDGKKDLVITGGGGGPLSVMLGKGDGTFQAAVKYTVAGSSNTRAVIADFNLDGKLDAAVGTLSGVVDVFFGDGTGKFSTTPATFRVGGPITALATSDFNGDKKPDLAAAGQDIGTVTLLHQ